jgi:hypothetical protein
MERNAREPPGISNCMNGNSSVLKTFEFCTSNFQLAFSFMTFFSKRLTQILIFHYFAFRLNGWITSANQIGSRSGLFIVEDLTFG